MKRALFRKKENMNWRLIITLTALIWALTAAAEAQNTPARLKILIDPAHGGQDHGVKIGDKKEKDLVLALALKIKAEMANIPSVEIHLTRSDDRTLSVLQRSDLARNIDPHIFLSLHINAGFSKSAGGYEVFFPGFKTPHRGNGEPAAIIADMEKNKHLNDTVRFAQGLLKNLEQVFPRKGRGLREAPVLILDNLPFPAMIVELGFATHTEERKALTREKTQAAIVDAFVKTIKEFDYR